MNLNDGTSASQVDQHRFTLDPFTNPGKHAISQQSAISSILSANTQSRAVSSGRRLAAGSDDSVTAADPRTTHSSRPRGELSTSRDAEAPGRHSIFRMARFRLSLLVGCAGLILSSDRLFAQNGDWIGPALGGYSNGAYWSPEGAPNGNFAGATLGAAGSYPLLLSNFSPTLFALSVTSPSATMYVISSTLTIRSSLSTAGTIFVNDDTNGGTNDITFATSGCTLATTGSGRLTLRSTTATNTARLISSGSFITTIVAGSTVNGRGEILGTFTNRGLIGGSVNYPGMVIRGATTQLGSGQLFAGQDEVGNPEYLTLGSGATVTGGLLLTQGTGTMYARDSSAINGITNQANLRVLAGHTLRVQNTLTNGAPLTVNDDTSSSTSRLELAQGAEIAGTAPIVLNSNSNASYARLTTGSGGTETARIAAGASVVGRGWIEGIWTNNGTIGGGLSFGVIVRGAVTQQGAGRMLAGDAPDRQTVSIGNGSVTGGTLQTQGTGVVYAFDNGAINNVTNQANLRVLAGHTLRVQNTLTNSAPLTVNDDTSSSTSRLELAQGAVITGTAPVVLNSNSNASYARLTTGTSGTETASIAAGASVVGRGWIEGIWTNNGTIGGGLSFGVIVRGAVTQQGTGRLLAGDAPDRQTVSIGNGSVTGGTLQTQGTGVVYAFDNGAINNVTNQANLRVLAGHTLRVQNTLTNSAPLTVNDDTSSSTSRLEMAQGAVIAGTAPIVLNANSNASYARLTTADAGLADATVQSSVTISGRGWLEGKITHRGVLAPGGDNFASALVVAGPVTLASTSRLDIELGGASDTQRDVLFVNAGATLALNTCILRVRLINGYRPTECVTHRFLQGSGRSGSFNAVLDLSPDLIGRVVGPDYSNPNFVSITILPPRCSVADIASDNGDPLPPFSPCVAGRVNTGVNEGDYNAFFQGFFEAAPQCNIADDQGTPLSPFGSGGSNGVPNTGVNEGDYNCFFQFFFNGCS